MLYSGIDGASSRSHCFTCSMTLSAMSCSCRCFLVASDARKAGVGVWVATIGMRSDAASVDGSGMWARGCARAACRLCRLSTNHHFSSDLFPSKACEETRSLVVGHDMTGCFGCLQQHAGGCGSWRGVSHAAFFLYALVAFLCDATIAGGYLLRLPL